MPLTDQTIYNHLAGTHTIGVYPLLLDETCCFLAVDFDDEHWRDDIQAFYESCQESSIPVSIEISRSGQGAHAWIFFSEAVSAREARRLGAALVSQTCARTRQLSLTSYDRFFPNQDTLPKGGFGNVPRILLATGKLVGEGFDYPPLDTLMLAMPISWKGILQQYAGRLHRNHPTKTDVRIYDYVELGHPLLARMWEKRVRGYLAMGYTINGSLLDGGTLTDSAKAANSS